MRPYIALGSVFMLLGLFGCRDKDPSPRSSFRFEVEHVFYIQPPVDRVILVGIVREGTVKAGDKATVSCRSGDVEVTVEGIETRGPEIKQAGAGQQVGLRLQGINQGQPTTGDWVVGKLRDRI